MPMSELSAAARPHVVFVHQTFSVANSEGSGRANAIAAAAVRAGYRVSVLGGANSYLTGATPASIPRIEESDGYTVYRPRTYAKLHKSFLHRALYFLVYMWSSFWVLLRMPRPDVIIGCSPPITVAASAFAVSKLRGCPFVFEVRDLWPAFPIQMGVLKNRLVIWMSLWLERTLYRNARMVVINSPGFIPHLEANNVRGDRTRQVPNGVDVEAFRPVASDPAIRAALGAVVDFVVLYIGAHGQANDLDRLIDVAGLLRGDDRLHFLLIGDGKDKRRLVERARSLQLANITFMAPQPKHEMARFIASADLCFASLQNISMFTTTYPNKIFDYMACGKATLTTIDGVSREVIEKAGCGLYAPQGDPRAIADAVLWATRHGEELKAMGERGRRHAVAEWDRRLFAAKFVDVLNEIVGQPNCV